MNLSSLLRVLRVLPLVALSGCANVLDIEDTKLDTEPPPRTGPWRCLGTLNSSKPSEIPESIDLKMTALDYGKNLAPTAGITFRACADTSRPDCIGDDVVGEGTTDDSGSATFQVKTIPNLGFVGFIKILDSRTAAQKNGGKDFVPFHWYFASPLYRSLVPVPASVVATQADVDYLASGAVDLSTLPDNTAGLNHVSATVVDCDNVPVAGATLSVLNAQGKAPDGSIAWYLGANGQAAVSASGSTGGGGLGGSLFLTPGFVYTVTSKNSDGATTSQGSVRLVAGVFSTILMLAQ